MTLLALAAVPVLGALLLGVFARPLSRVLPPSVAAVALAAAAVATAVCCGLTLSVLAIVSLGQAAPSLSDWSPRALRHAGALPVPLGVACAGLVTALLVHALLHAAGIVRGHLRAHRAVAGAGVDRLGLTVIDHGQPVAFSLARAPRRPGRVVVSTSLLATIPAVQQRIVLAHERAHVRHRHHYLGWAAGLAAAANPLLGAVPGAVRHACERWADETAAAEIGDRRVTGLELARAALAVAAHGAPEFGANGGDVPARVRSLLRADPRRRPALTTLLLAVAALGCVATAISTARWHEVVETAEAAYRGGR